MKLWNRFHFVKLTASNSDNQSSSTSILAEILGVIYFLWCHHWQATENQFQLVELISRVNEVKPCGLVQQLILQMLRDLILQYSDSHLLNGNNLDDPLLKYTMSANFQANNFEFFGLILPKKGSWNRNFKKLSPDAEPAPPRYHVC